MKRALSLARRGLGLVEPNPMVGCVLVRNGRIVGEGYHHRFGGPHAEVEALRQASSPVRGATAYVTLEPCCHQGKTPPCALALIEAGIGCVVGAMIDPFSVVAGRGFSQLRRAGVDVQVGLLEAEAAELNAPFLTRQILKRPFVIAKWAQSLDGKTATTTGNSMWISSEASRRCVHRLRSRVDAVLVGINTVLADDPLLTARGVRVRRRAMRVVLDSRLRIPLDCRLVATAQETPTTVMTLAHRARRSKRAQLEERGVKVVSCRARGESVSLRDALGKLAGLRCTNVLAEGGGEVTGALIDAGLVDEVQVFTAPMLIGGRSAPTGCSGRGVSLVTRATVARSVHRRMIGPDQLTVMRLTDPPGDKAARD